MNTEPAPVLDDLAQMQAIDRRNMLRLITELPEQFETAMGIIRGFTIEPLTEKPNAIFITGVGNSAMAADMAAETLADELDVPIVSDHGARLPGYIGESSLVVATGYDGKSESTLRNYREARQRGAQVVCVASGGELAQWAAQDGVRIVKIPPGQAARTAIGYLLVPLLVLVEKLELAEGISDRLSHAIKLMKNTREALRVEYSSTRNLAKQTAALLSGKTPVIYGATGYRRCIARRWSSQIASNAKTPAFDDGFPCAAITRMSGWEREEGSGNYSLVFLRDAADRGEVTDLMNAAASVLSRFEVAQIEMRGASTLEKLLYGIYLGDFVSYYLAMLNGVDPTPMEYVAQIDTILAPPEEPS